MLICLRLAEARHRHYFSGAIDDCGINFLSKILRNESHFSEGYRSVNYIGLLAKCMNLKGVHVNFASDPMQFTLPTSEKLSSLLIFTFLLIKALKKNNIYDIMIYVMKN